MEFSRRNDEEISIFFNHESEVFLNFFIFTFIHFINYSISIIYPLLRKKSLFFLAWFLFFSIYLRHERKR